MIDLSILICSTHTRYETFGREIQRQVWSQYHALSEEDQDRIEILMLTDNKKMMLGQKRNIMVDAAQGRYVQFIDDDDRIESDMFKSILDATESNADVITFIVNVSLNGGEPKPCFYSKWYTEDENLEDSYLRLPNHICVVKREVASKVSFPNILYGEDSAYSKLLREHLRTEFNIPRVLYHYDYNSGTTETQKHLSTAMRIRQIEPIVDVVMLSNSDTLELQMMTQNAINTCIAGANSLPVNVIVIEGQEGVEYDNALTVEAVGEFAYNKYMNRGARYGKAEWILFANNDLVFTDGWLHQLLAANNSVVSPKNPGDFRQTDLTRNQSGSVNGRHFSGWCFMMKRELWLEIGGLDEDFKFWCSDDAVVEQIIKQSVYPMLVTNSIVQHLRSKTLDRIGESDGYTWAEVKKFNEKYGYKKFEDDSRFIEYLERTQ